MLGGAVAKGPGMLLTIQSPTATLAELEDLYVRTVAYAESAKATATRRAYASDFADFERFCRHLGEPSLPALPATIAAYIASLGKTKKPATIQRRLTSISVVHHNAGLESPTVHPGVRSVWAGIRNARGVAQRGKDAILTDDLRALVGVLDDRRLIGLRDRALLLVGFAGAFRRSEIVSLDVEDVRFVDAGLEVHLRRSKTDQAGEGRLIGLPYGSNRATCPVRSLQAWIAAAEFAEGPIFRHVDRHGRIAGQRLSPAAVADVVKRCAQRAGLDPARVAGHSLRAGFVTSAALRGVSETLIAEQTGHKSLTTLRRYVRPATVWQQNAAAKVGL